MKVRASVKKICRNCKIVRRNRRGAGDLEAIPVTSSVRVNGSGYWRAGVMARIAGINIPPNKHVGIALTHIFGVGRQCALDVCEASGIAPDVKVKDLTEPEESNRSVVRSRGSRSKATCAGKCP